MTVELRSKSKPVDVDSEFESDTEEVTINGWCKNSKLQVQKEPNELDLKCISIQASSSLLRARANLLIHLAI